ncbi:Mov34/MPN/PAD-1 family protein [Salinispora oceanensis]|uniref:Mov34/MPN/PAD-1 family protein n=1 Tax=Salinispora oceanensis TaxID=1050199 RepID=UPI000366A65C|nr:Mov34/MPN/PAD-1 family protein [Salinispora oceanensis]
MTHVDDRPAPGGGIPTREHLARIFAAAVRAFPAEACGFVRRSGVRECENAVERRHADGSRTFDRTVTTGYAFTAADLLELARSLDTDDPVLVIYHSHPNVGAYFSAEDQRYAVTDGSPTYPVDHLVVDVTPSGVRGARKFGFCARTRRYVPIQTYGNPMPPDDFPPIEGHPG